MLSLTLALASGTAAAATISLRQIGGTVTDGVGRPGDTVVAVIEADFYPRSIIVGLEWDREGGSVLDISFAQAAFGNSYLHGSGPDDAVPIAIGSAFPSTFDGPTQVLGWKFGPLPENDLPVPTSLSVGTATFVLREPGTTTVDFITDADNPLATALTAVMFVESPDGFYVPVVVDLDNALLEFEGLTIQVIPEPSTAPLLAIGLIGLALRQRAART